MLFVRCCMNLKMERFDHFRRISKNPCEARMKYFRTENIIIRTSKCHVNIYSMPKAKRTWPNILRHNYDSSFWQHRYMVVTQVGNRVELGNTPLEFGSAITYIRESNNTKYITISGSAVLHLNFCEPFNQLTVKLS